MSEQEVIKKMRKLPTTTIITFVTFPVTGVSLTLMRDLIFYTVAGTIIGLIAQLAGANFTVIILTSLLIPPLFLLIIRIIRITRR